MQRHSAVAAYCCRLIILPAATAAILRHACHCRCWLSLDMLPLALLLFTLMPLPSFDDAAAADAATRRRFFSTTAAMRARYSPISMLSVAV